MLWSVGPGAAGPSRASPSFFLVEICFSLSCAVFSAPRSGCALRARGRGGRGPWEAAYGRVGSLRRLGAEAKGTYCRATRRIDAGGSGTQAWNMEAE